MCPWVYLRHRLALHSLKLKLELLGAWGWRTCPPTAGPLAPSPAPCFVRQRPPSATCPRCSAVRGLRLQQSSATGKAHGPPAGREAATVGGWGGALVPGSGVVFQTTNSRFRINSTAFPPVILLPPPRSASQSCTTAAPEYQNNPRPRIPPRIPPPTTTPRELDLGGTSLGSRASSRAQPARDSTGSFLRFHLEARQQNATLISPSLLHQIHGFDSDHPESIHPA